MTWDIYTSIVTQQDGFRQNDSLFEEYWQDVQACTLAYGVVVVECPLRSSVSYEAPIKAALSIRLCLTSETNSRTTDFTVRRLLYGCVIIYYGCTKIPPVFTGIN